MKLRQRLVYAWGPQSCLMYGDPERDDDRYWISGPDLVSDPLTHTQGGETRTGCALPVLLGEGWTVHSLQPAGTGDQSPMGGAVLILLERPTE